MPDIDATLKYAVIDAYREELRRRYLMENIRRFEVLAGFPEPRIRALRDYFLECIYPASGQRVELDDAFDRMGEIIRSPKRLAPLMLMAAKSVWKFGLMFPSAVAAGAHTLEACLETRRLESKMLEYARKHKLEPDDVARRETMVRMVDYVPESEVLRFRNDVLKLFRALSNVKLIAATVQIMENSKKLMLSRPDLYHEQELAGFRLGHEVLERGLALFRQLKPAEFPRIIGGIEAVEIDWYDRIKAEAAAL